MSNLQYMALLSVIGLGVYVIAKIIELANREQLAVLRQIAAALESRNTRTRDGD